MCKSCLFSEIIFYIHMHRPVVETCGKDEKQTCNVEKMAFSNSLYASQTICPLVIWSPTAVTALSKMDLTLSIPPGNPMPPMEYWAYSSQISGPEMTKTQNSDKNARAVYHTNLLTMEQALTDIILHSPFKKFIDFLPIWFFLRQVDFILEPIQPYFCRTWQKWAFRWKVLLSGIINNLITHTLTFSEWEELAHPLPCLTQREKLPLLLQEFD